MVYQLDYFLGINKKCIYICTDFKKVLKKLIFKKMRKYLLLLVAFGVLVFSSCASKSSEEQASDAPEVDETEMLNDVESSDVSVEATSTDTTNAASTDTTK